MSGSSATFTSDQHLALVQKAVEDATASLTAEKAALADRVETLESEKAAQADELAKATARVDVLEAEKTISEKASADARAELEAFKAEIQRAAEIETLKAERAARVKAANANLGEDFFTDERVTRWATQTAEAFDAFVADISEMGGGDAGTGVTQQARQTAAFSGGQSPVSTGGASVAAFLSARVGHTA